MGLMILVVLVILVGLNFYSFSGFSAFKTGGPWAKNAKADLIPPFYFLYIDFI